MRRRQRRERLPFPPRCRRVAILTDSRGIQHAKLVGFDAWLVAVGEWTTERLPAQNCRSRYKEVFLAGFSCCHSIHRTTQTQLLFWLREWLSASPAIVTARAVTILLPAVFSVLPCPASLQAWRLAPLLFQTYWWSKRVIWSQNLSANYFSVQPAPQRKKLHPHFCLWVFYFFDVQSY